jgi:hypothetical protein
MGDIACAGARTYRSKAMTAQQIKQIDHNNFGWNDRNAEERNKALKSALLTYKHRHESGGPMSEIKPDSCMCSACDKARAALTEDAALTEKEKNER